MTYDYNYEQGRLDHERFIRSVERDRFDRCSYEQSEADHQFHLDSIEHKRNQKQKELERMQQGRGLLTQANQGNAISIISRKSFTLMLESAYNYNEIQAINNVIKNKRLSRDCVYLEEMLHYAGLLEKIDEDRIKYLARVCIDSHEEVDMAGSAAFRFVGRRDIARFTTTARIMMRSFVNAYRKDMAELSRMYR